MAKIRFLSGNVLKILAAIFMTVDHIGLMFFPSVRAFRIIGRLAFPIFAFMISEGARYTRSKIKYLLSIMTLAVLCQIAYFLFDGSLYMSILVTFSLSIIMIYALEELKKQLFTKSRSLPLILLSLTLFVLTVLLCYAFCKSLSVDYGFRGALVPLIASIPDMRGISCPDGIKRIDCLPVRILFLSAGLLLLAESSSGIQYYSLLAIPLLLLYSGKRGRVNMKYFFYVFYPLHLVILEGIYILVHSM